MMESPLVSILIPCYNVSGYIEECLNSVLGQTYHNLQVVAIDDGSKDTTLSILKKRALADSRLEVYSQPNQGVAATRNNLLAKAKGEYILFVDSDDWIEPEMVEFLVTEAISNDAELVTCSMVRNYTKVNSSYNLKEYSRNEILEKFLYHKEITGSLWNKLIKRALLRDIEFDKEISYGEDALFCWELLKRVNKVIFSNRELYHYRMNSESISHQKFGSKKLTGYKVWEYIANDTARYNANLYSLALASRGTQSYYLLMQAGADNFEKEERIKQLQDVLRRTYSNIRTYGLLSGKELLNANLVRFWYGYANFYYKLYKFKNRK